MHVNTTYSFYEQLKFHAQAGENEKSFMTSGLGSGIKQRLRVKMWIFFLTIGICHEHSKELSK